MSGKRGQPTTPSADNPSLFATEWRRAMGYEWPFSPAPTPPNSHLYSELLWPDDYRYPEVSQDDEQRTTDEVHG